MKDPVHLLQDAIVGERHVLRGYEKPSETLTFETLRALDYAFCRELIPELKELDESGLQMESIRKHSINAALKRVLPSELKADAPRLFSSNAATAEQTDEFLWRMGCLTMAEKQLTLLRSGALKGEIDKRKLKGMTLLVLSIQDSTAYREQIGFQGLNWLSDMTVAEDRSKEAALELRHMEMLPRLTGHLRGNPSPEDRSFDGVDDYFKEWAVLYLRRMSFRDMLADDDSFGGRAYSAYVGVLETLSAMSQQRLCYAGLLNADDPRIGVRNLLTGGALHEELIEGVASFLDASRQEVSELLDHLTLSPANAKDHLERGAQALAPAVRTSKHLVALPMYGLELNPFLFLWAELRRRYEKDWFEAANRRESRWVAELRAQFATPHWHCFDGVKLKRDGKTITDIDFVAYDASCSSVILFQLKWQQPLVGDDKVRRNNASNLVDDSNKWIADVVGWIEAAGANGLKGRLAIKTNAALSIHLVVLGRYHAHFTSASGHDSRAVWCDWGNFLRERAQRPSESADEFVAYLRKSVERVTAEVAPESFLIPLGGILMLVNPTRIHSMNS
ncbi:hypothetical protein [Burkholderia pseudomallei]|uniref:hypothetical protein n=1 Tax=Burkholderia pseudomallei TaxID=28450 RepID=UPI000F070056|nr:hypothetical protein [Burkholderia pseudomallei]VBS64399.1 Uncharacterised protein [Burkholderia pseudomallei]